MRLHRGESARSIGHLSGWQVFHSNIADSSMQADAKMYAEQIVKKGVCAKDLLGKTHRRSMIIEMMCKTFNQCTITNIQSSLK